jgi:peptide/nickel transport system permease protein
VFRKRWGLIAAIFVLALWVLVLPFSFFDPNLNPIAVLLPHRLEGPSWEFWFGVDPNGQSIGALLIKGASTSLIVSVATVACCLGVGIPLGAVAGYFGGWWDIILTRIMDILLAFPPLILPIAMMAFWGSGFVNVILALSLTGWVSYARLVRGQFLAIKEREYIQSARALGASNGRIMTKHIFPNTVGPLVVQGTFSLATVILAEAGLSFLGLGVGGASWGSMLNQGKDYLISNPGMVFFPSLAIFTVVMGLNVWGELLRKRFEVKKRG